MQDDAGFPTEEDIRYARAMYQTRMAHFRLRKIVSRRLMNLSAEDRAVAIAVMDGRPGSYGCDDTCVECDARRYREGWSIGMASRILRRANHRAKKAQQAQATWTAAEMDQAIAVAMEKDVRVVVRITRGAAAVLPDTCDATESLLTLRRIADGILSRDFHPVKLTVRAGDHEDIVRATAYRENGQSMDGLTVAMRPLALKAEAAARQIIDSDLWHIQRGMSRSEIDDVIRQHVDVEMFSGQPPLYGIRNIETGRLYFVSERKVIAEPEKLNTSFEDFAKVWFLGGWSLDHHLNAGMYGYEIPANQRSLADRVGFVAVAVASLPLGSREPNMIWLTDVSENWPLS